MNYKKLITLCTIFLALFSLNLFAESSITYSDLSNDHWAFNSISEMTRLGILEGYNDGTFKPNDAITREQFAKILVLSQDMPLINPITPTFKDVNKDDWAYRYIETAKGYFSGYTVADNNYFNGTDLAIRENVAVAMVKAKDLYSPQEDLSLLNNYLDKDDINSDIMEYISIAVQNKIMEGYGDGLFGPKDVLTRAQACELIYKATIVYKDTSGIISSDPKNKSTNVDPRNPIILNFPESTIFHERSVISLINLDNNNDIEILTQYDNGKLIITPKQSLELNTTYNIKIPGNTLVIEGTPNKSILFEFTTAPSFFQVINNNYSINTLEIFNDDYISFKHPKEFVFLNENPEDAWFDENFPPKLSSYNNILIRVEYLQPHTEALKVDELSKDELYIFLEYEYPNGELLKNANNTILKYNNDGDYFIKIYGKFIEEHASCITVSYKGSNLSDKDIKLIDEISDTIINTLK